MERHRWDQSADSSSLWKSVVKSHQALAHSDSEWSALQKSKDDSSQEMGKWYGTKPADWFLNGPDYTKCNSKVDASAVSTDHASFQGTGSFIISMDESGKAEVNYKSEAPSGAGNKYFLNNCMVYAPSMTGNSSYSNIFIRFVNVCNKPVSLSDFIIGGQQGTGAESAIVNAHPEWSVTGFPWSADNRDVETYSKNDMAIMKPYADLAGSMTPHVIHVSNTSGTIKQGQSLTISSQADTNNFNQFTAKDYANMHLYSKAMDTPSSTNNTLQFSLNLGDIDKKNKSGRKSLYQALD